MGRNSENDLIYFRPFNKNNLEFYPSIFTDLRFYIKEDFHRPMITDQTCKSMLALHQLVKGTLKPPCEV